MSALFASKNTEAKIIASIRSMGAESLNPDDYEDLERILNNMCETRSIDSNTLNFIAEELKISNSEVIYSTDTSTNLDDVIYTIKDKDLKTKRDKMHGEIWKK